MSYQGGEPYKATRLWLEAVAIFRKEVPLGKHRRQWKSYDECFVASDAISWFTTQLKQKFEPNITGKQAHALLQKFYKAGIFCSINSSYRSSPSANSNPNSSVIKETDFKDNGLLYRLVGWNPQESVKLKRSGHSNLKSKTDLESQIPKFNIIIHQLSNSQINSIWEQAFIDRLAKIIGLDVIRAFFTPHIIQGCWISHNLTQVGKYGVVLPQSTTQKDDLPSWLVSAMKCLANWPSHHTLDAGIPNYPNFERDVFKLICEYFSIYKEGVPLLTFDLYDAFIKTFIHAELFDFNSRLYTGKGRGTVEANAATSTFHMRSFQQQFQFIGTSGFTPAHGSGFVREEPYPFNTSESIENLIMDILTPGVAGRPKSRPLGNLRRKHIVPKRINLGTEHSIPSSSVPLLLGESLKTIPKPMNENVYDISRYASSGAKRSPFFYETAFTDGSPITRVMSKTELKSSMGTLPKPEARIPARPSTLNNLNVRPGASSAPEEYGYAYENPSLELSASDMINHPKYCAILKAEMKTLDSPSELCSSYSFETRGRKASGQSNGINRNPSTADIRQRIISSPLRPNTRSYSATHLSDIGTDRSPYFPEQCKLGLRGALAVSEYSSPPSKSVHRTLDFYYGADACIPGLMTAPGKQMAILSFRLLTLLLPPTRRRHLQLLLRCMSKMSKNEKLMLSSDRSKTTRATVINTFFRCIMYCADEAEFDELLALRIVTFMMDNDSEIFCVNDEEGIVRGVQELISAQQIIKVPLEKITVSTSKADLVESQEIFVSNHLEESENKENVQYCKRITLNEYESQSLLGGTAKSLRNLLDAIVENPKMDEKERKKRLKQFSNEYPHIFQEKFGDETASYSTLSESNNSKSSKKKSIPFRLFRFRF